LTEQRAPGREPALKRPEEFIGDLEAGERASETVTGTASTERARTTGTRCRALPAVVFPPDAAGPALAGEPAGNAGSGAAGSFAGSAGKSRGACVLSCTAPVLLTICTAESRQTTITAGAEGRKRR